MSIGTESAGLRSGARAPQTRDDEGAIYEVVAGYYDAFVRDSALAATYYGEPALIVLPDEVFSLPTRKEVETFLAKALSGLKALGYLNTEMTGSRIQKLNATTALFGTVATRMKADGTELQRAAFTYLLHKGSAGWKIHELVATDVDKLIG